MFEQHPTPEQKPHLSEGEANLPREKVLNNSVEVERGLRVHEQEILEHAGSVFGDADAEKLRKPSFRALAAALVFCSALNASPVVADSEDSVSGKLLESDSMSEHKEDAKQQGGTGQSRIFKDIDVSFDWDHVARELSTATPEQNPDFESVDVVSWNAQLQRFVMDSYDPIKSSKVYEGVSRAEHLNTLFSLWKNVKSAKDYHSFREYLHTSSFSEQQKLIILQNLGGYLSATYNDDMFAQNEHIIVSDDKMFEGVQSFLMEKDRTKVVPTGICGNIHTFVAKAAAELGFDAWLQSGVAGRDAVGHVWIGLVAKDTQGKEQIMFLDYSTLVPTGTMNYRDALGVWERHTRQISVFGSYIGSTEEVIAPTKSLAQETIESATGVQGSERILEERLREGKIAHPEGMHLSVSEDITNITFSKDMLAFSFTRTENTQNNPYQSLSSMDAFRGTLRFGGEHLGGEFDTTLLNVSLKDLENNVFRQSEIISRLETDFINSHDFTSEEYGKFVVEYGASIEIGIRKILGVSETESGLAGGGAEGSAGVQVLYTDPTKVGMVYVGVSDTRRAELSDFQNQEVVLEDVSQKIRAGAELQVREGTILNLDLSSADLGYGKKDTAKLGLGQKDMTAYIEGERNTTNLGDVMPSNEKLTLGATYHSSERPFGEISVFGAIKNDHYKSGDKANYEVGLKVRVLVW